MIKVLNHGFVRLVDHMGSDLSIVRSARISYDAEWRAGEDEGSDARLIDYLIRNHHTSPLEAVVFTFEVKAPISTLRQWHRHRTWAFNEVSARYSELPEEYYVPEPGMYGAQSKNNKQQRDIEQQAMGVDNETYLKEERWAREQGAMMFAAFKLYQKHIQEGMPRELARNVLPLATYSHMFATVNLNNLAKFLKLRYHSHAQYEILVFAKAMLELILPIVPVAAASFIKHQEIGK